MSVENAQPTANQAPVDTSPAATRADLYNAFQQISVEDAPSVPETVEAEPQAIDTQAEVVPDVVPEAVDSDAPVEAGDLDDAFEAYLKELEAAPEDPEAVEDAELMKQGSERLQERVRKLANERKQAIGQAEQLQQQLQQQQQQLRHMQEFINQYVKSNVAVQPKPQSRQAPQPAQDPNDPYAGLINELSPRLKQQFEQMLTPLQQKLNAYEKIEQERAQQMQAQAQQAEYARIEAELFNEAKSLRSIVLPGLPEDVLSDDAMGALIDRELVAESVINNTPLKDSVPHVRKKLSQLLRIGNQAARSRGKQLTNRGEMPQMPTNGVPASTKESSLPQYSIDQLRQAGYSTSIQAAADNYKRLQGVQPAGW